MEIVRMARKGWRSLNIDTATSTKVTIIAKHLNITTAKVIELMVCKMFNIKRDQPNLLDLLSGESILNLIETLNKKEKEKGENNE